MIAGIFHEGSGLGNQLHRYVATRVLAEDKGFVHSMVNPWNFKGKDFMDLRMGGNYPMSHLEWNEKKVVENGVDIRSYDPDINFVQDNTVIDGEFQDPRYFEHRLDDIREWLHVESLEMPKNLCVINFRGGEYVGVPDLFLGKEYWDKAIASMRNKYANVKFDYSHIDFEVHTDDAVTASKFFPDFPIIQDIAYNWRAIRYAKHLILSNSSFAILPALLGPAEEILAPKYWAGYNKGFWQLQQNYYDRFTYIS